MAWQKLGVSQDVRHRLFLKASLVCDFFWKHLAKKHECVGALRQIEWGHASQETRIIQSQIKHQTLRADQDQLTGCPLDFQGAAEVLVRIGGNLDDLAEQLRGEAEADVHNVPWLVHRTDEFQQSLQRV